MACLGILLLPHGFGTAVFEPGIWIERQVHAMGTELLVRVRAGDAATAVAAAERAIAAVERVEALLSTWRDDTPLARLNAAMPGAAVPLPPVVLALLGEARALSDVTDHAFDPTIGAVVDVWDLRGSGREPRADELESARAAVGWRHFALDSAGAVRGHPRAWIDSGGFGKGAALRIAGQELAAAAVDVAILNFGGQVLVVGAAGGTPTEVSIAHPAERSRAVAWIRLRTGSIATTGQSEQRVVVEGEPLGHVVDPRSGRPAPAWGSVTVLDADPLRADVLSTALFVLGPEAGWEWAERHDVAALFVERTTDPITIRGTSALAGVQVREGR